MRHRDRREPVLRNYWIVAPGEVGIHAEIGPFGSVIAADVWGGPVCVTGLLVGEEDHGSV